MKNDPLLVLAPGEITSIDKSGRYGEHVRDGRRYDVVNKRGKWRYTGNHRPDFVGAK